MDPQRRPDTYTCVHRHITHLRLARVGGPAVYWNNRKHHGCQHFSVLIVCFWVSGSAFLSALCSLTFKETVNPNDHMKIFLTYQVIPSHAHRLEYSLFCSKHGKIALKKKCDFPATVSPLLGTDPLKPQWSFKVLAGRRFSISNRPLKFFMHRLPSNLHHFWVCNKSVCLSLSLEQNLFKKSVFCVHIYVLIYIQLVCARHADILTFLSQVFGHLKYDVCDFSWFI